MSRGLKTIRTVAGNDALQDVIAGKEMKKAGVGVARLNSMEVSRLKSRDVIVEQDIKFKAMVAAAEEMYPSVLGDAELEETEETVTAEDFFETTEKETKKLKKKSEKKEKSGKKKGKKKDSDTESEEARSKKKSKSGKKDKTSGKKSGRNKRNLDRTREAEAGNELCDPLQEWNLRAARAENYVNQSASGRKIRIAILDSGVNYRPDIDVKDWVTTMAGNGMEMGCFALPDASGHGTAIASLINGSPSSEGIRGMNADAEIYSVQVLDENNIGHLSNVVQGIYWAIENHMDIINMSFGTTTNSQILYEAVKDAKDAGILMVAAAGNNGGTSAVYPAAYDEVMSVGASNMQGEVASDSTHGANVDIYAPGEDVMTNGPLFDTMVISGSSIACAEVTAAASVIWEKGHGKGARFVRELLQETANGRMDSSHENGMLDLEAAMDHYSSFSVGDTITPVTEKPMPVFDEGEVKALWRHEGHENSVPESAKRYKILKAASTFPDRSGKRRTTCNEEINPLRVNRRFHGDKNYWVTIHFLIDLAHAYYQGGTANNPSQANNVMAKARNGILGKVEKHKATSPDDFHYSTTDVISMYLEDTNVFDTSYDESTCNIKAYKVMGIAIHTIGDIYAHRTFMKASDFSDNSDDESNGKIYIGYLNNFDKIMKAIKDGRMEFRNINGYRNNKCPNDYEDDSNFRKYRYIFACETVKSLVLTTGSKYFAVNSWQGDETLKHSGTLTKYPLEERDYSNTSLTYTTLVDENALD